MVKYTKNKDGTKNYENNCTNKMWYNLYNHLDCEKIEETKKKHCIKKKKEYVVPENFDKHIEDKAKYCKPKGRVLMSFELVPKEISEKDKKNGAGRD